MYSFYKVPWSRNRKLVIASWFSETTFVFLEYGLRIEDTDLGILVVVKPRNMAGDTVELDGCTSGEPLSLPSVLCLFPSVFLGLCLNPFRVKGSAECAAWLLTLDGFIFLRLLKIFGVYGILKYEPKPGEVLTRELAASEYRISAIAKRGVGINMIEIFVLRIFCSHTRT